MQGVNCTGGLGERGTGGGGQGEGGPQFRNKI